MRITFITGNTNKARFVAEWVERDIAHHQLDIEEIQSLDLHEVVEHKAKSAYKILKSPVLVEDASLTFAAMGRLPGTYIRWFIEELGIEGLCKLLNAYEDRSAHATVCYGLYDGKQLHLFDGQMHGTISDASRGNGGFGFDAIFINNGYNITRAEMDDQSYKTTSYRYEPLNKLASFLDQLEDSLDT